MGQAAGRLTEEEELEYGLFVPKDKKLCMAAPFASGGLVSHRSSNWKDWLNLGPLTLHQVFYIFIMNGIGAAIISGAANFGVAVAMYRTTDDPIRIWPFDDNTIAGDMGVTVVIQQIVTYAITSQLCNFDLRHGLKPLRRPWPPMLHFPSTCKPSGSYLGVQTPEDVQKRGQLLYMGNGENQGPFAQFCLWFLRATSTGSERNDLFARGITPRQRLERLIWTLLQGGWWAVITFWWYWPIAIAIVSPIYEHDNMVHTWIPPIIKLLFGGILGLLTNPFIALFALGAESHVRRFYPQDTLWEEAVHYEDDSARHTDGDAAGAGDIVTLTPTAEANLHSTKL